MTGNLGISQASFVHWPPDRSFTKRGHNVSSIYNWPRFGISQSLFVHWTKFYEKARIFLALTEDLGITRSLFVHCAKFYKKAQICPLGQTEVLRKGPNLSSRTDRSFTSGQIGLTHTPITTSRLRANKQSLNVNIHGGIENVGFNHLSHFEAFHNNQIMKTVYN